MDGVAKVSDGVTGIEGGTASFASNRWDHLAMTWASDTASFYLNGQLMGQTPSVGLALDDQAMLMGCDSNAGMLAIPLEGGLDEVRVYGRALTLDEIVALTQ